MFQSPVYNARAYDRILMVLPVHNFPVTEYERRARIIARYDNLRWNAAEAFAAAPHCERAAERYFIACMQSHRAQYMHGQRDAMLPHYADIVRRRIAYYRKIHA